jgi:hypothetical protein
MCSEPLYLVLRPLDHCFEVGDELIVDAVVRCPERIERGRAGSVEDAQHREFLWGRGVHGGLFAAWPGSVTHLCVRIQFLF